MCHIAWTETARGAERCAFEHEFPVTLRFGLHIEPGFMTSAEHITAHLFFQVFHRHQNGEILRYNHRESLSASDLPGAPGPDLWVGMALGQAFQLTQASGVRHSGVFDFRPHVFFERSGSLLGAFAVAPEQHSFVMLTGRLSDGSEFESERLVGGLGRPA